MVREKNSLFDDKDLSVGVGKKWGFLSKLLSAELTKIALNPWRDRCHGTVHVLFLFVDHFELAGKEPRLAEWMLRYPKLAARHRDSDDVPPKHTWFYALDLMREAELRELRGFVERGFGEIELHWHHSYDTPASFRKKLLEGLSTFMRHGFMMPVGHGKPGCFAFIHGNWSLANSLGDRFCGVDSELGLLEEIGCYGDFTFPALYSEAQPRTINTIYYANANGGAKSYERGRRSSVGRPEAEGEFLIFQGPLTINWRDWRFGWHPLVEHGEIGRSMTHGEPMRIDCWVRQGIHVMGRPEWVFVKAFCHGGQDYDAVLGDSTDKMFSYLEEAYNDGQKYRLHYVTAREAYNIVKAAEDGKTGDPNLYRDYVIPPPLER